MMCDYPETCRQGAIRSGRRGGQYRLRAVLDAVAHGVFQVELSIAAVQKPYVLRV